MSQEPSPGSRSPGQTSAHVQRGLSSWTLTLLFLLLGASAFLIERCTRENPRDLLIVDEATVERLASLWESQTQRPPTDTELDALTQEFVREEILVREAMRLGLERDDVIIRRRLAQKLTFLLDDTSPPDPPSEEAVREYFEENAEFFSQPQRTSFQHVFCSEQHAQRTPELLEDLAQGAPWRSLGDPFMLRREYAERTDDEIDDLFGDGFANRLSDLPINQWQPPIRSALGLHIVRVIHRKEPSPADFESVRGRATNQFLDQRRQAANRKAYEKIAARYRVELPAARSAQPASKRSP